MKKPLYKSKTIRGAAIQFLVPLIGILAPALEEQRWPNQEEATALVVATFAFKETIEGRRRVQEATEGTPSNLSDQLDTEVFGLTSMSLQELPEDTADLEELDFTLEDDGKYTIEVLQDTKLKSKPIDSTKLTLNDIKDLPKGTKFEVDSYQVETNSNHIIVTAGNDKGYLYTPHIILRNTHGTTVNLDQSLVVKPIRANRKVLRLPQGKQVYLDDPIIPGGNFTWAEATKNGTRVPVDSTVVANIIKVAKVMQDVRKLFDNRPINVHSWYRDPTTNSKVGGAPRSKHLSGAAVDFSVVGVPIYTVQQRIETWGLSRGYGIGRGANRGFIHIDLGPRRVWNY